MKKPAWLTLFVAVPLSFIGCSTIMTGTTQEVSFNSNPDGARVTVGGRILGNTPFSASLKKRQGQEIEFEKEGYKPLKMELETRMNSWFWGNIVLGGFFGSTTDGVSGSVHEYSPHQYHVSLQPLGGNDVVSPVVMGQREKAREYILSSYKDIVNDLNKGSGPNLDSLIQMLNIPSADKNSAVKKIQGLSTAYENVLEFANHTIEIYLK